MLVTRVFIPWSWSWLLETVNDSEKMNYEILVMLMISILYNSVKTIRYWTNIKSIKPNFRGLILFPIKKVFQSFNSSSLSGVW